jgi:hypothetical protein
MTIASSSVAIWDALGGKCVAEHNRMRGEITTELSGPPQSRMEQGSSLFGMCVALSSTGQWPAPLLRSAERTTKEQLEESRLKKLLVRP